MLRPGGGTKYATRNQVQVFCMINAFKIFEVVLTTTNNSPSGSLHFSMDLILLSSLRQKTLAELESSLCPKEDLNLVPKR